MKNILIKFVITSLISTLAWAHGENKPGPHGGFIRMPGPFHTEVVPAGKNKIRVYLLDLHWKNPSVTKSKLTLKHVLKQSTDAKCKIETDHYVCVFPKSVNLQKGELKIFAERETQAGMEMSYQLPFRLEGGDMSESSGHGRH